MLSDAVEILLLVVVVEELDNVARSGRWWPMLSKAHDLPSMGLGTCKECRRNVLTLLELESLMMHAHV